jgi:hypothetical protein
MLNPFVNENLGSKRKFAIAIKQSRRATLAAADTIGLILNPSAGKHAHGTGVR